MVQRARTPLTLVGGIAIGLLIAGYAHTADAGTNPCINPKLPVPPPGHVLTTYTGDTITSKPDEDGDYFGAKKFTYRGSITLTATVTQIDRKKNASGTPFTQADVKGSIGLWDQFAIAPGDNPTQSIAETFTDSQAHCEFGCSVGIVEPSNISWHIVVTK